MLAALGGWCFRHRAVVVVAWAAALVALGGAAGTTGDGFSTQFSPPDVESARGLDLLEEHFDGAGGGFGGTIVFHAEQGVDHPAVREEMSEFFAAVDRIGGISVAGPYGTFGQGQIATEGPLAGEVAYARVEVADEISMEESAAISEEVEALAPELPGLRIEYGGQLFTEFEPPRSEIIGLGFAIVILIVAFGSVLAMGLPVGTAFGGIGAGIALVTVLSNVLTMPDFTTTLGIMLGLGVGIDYALFIVTRYREGLHAGIDPEASAALASSTAGRAVLFAGTTVVISLLGMLLIGLGFIRGLAVGAATVVFFTMVASVTLLPALLGLSGHRIELSRWRGVVAAGLVAVALVGIGLRLQQVAVLLPVALLLLLVGSFVPILRREVPRRRPKPFNETLPYRWSRLVQAHPWAAVVAGGTVLLVLAAPLLSIRLGFSDAGNFPEDTTTRQAYDLIAEAFGPGFNGPLVLVAPLAPETTPADLEAVSGALSRSEGVAEVSPPIPSDPQAPEAVLWRLVPTTSPQDEATEDLLHRLRADVLPAATEGTGLDVAITGQVAISADFTDYLGARLPVFIGVVLALSFVLLLVVFRSVLVPLKAVVMNLLGIGAAYGLVVAVFQWGWAKELVGVGSGGPVEPFIPMMMFAIVFGLSMDYEVFLLSRIKEEYDRGSANVRAVADGLAATARVITAAAAIMVVVFGSFLLESDRVIKIFGIGLASAVFLDATVVRMLLVPATMELLGDRNWWLPGWLERVLPRISVEGVRHDTPRAAGDLDGEPVLAGRDPREG